MKRRLDVQYELDVLLLHIAIEKCQSDPYKAVLIESELTIPLVSRLPPYIVYCQSNSCNTSTSNSSELSRPFHAPLLLLLSLLQYTYLFSSLSRVKLSKGRLVKVA